MVLFIPFTRQTHTLVPLEVGDEVIRTTREHPFWVVGAAWVEAQFLRPGALLMSDSGEPLPIKRIWLEYGQTTVYNFEVEDARDYFVSQEQVLVHNKACDLSQTKKALAKVHDKVGKQLKVGSGKGKYGSPTRGTAKKGYRLDPGHPGHTGVEKGPHINYWDYTKGKRGKGGISGAVPIG